jgi:hypothetical protein
MGKNTYDLLIQDGRASGMRRLAVLLCNKAMREAVFEKDEGLHICLGSVLPGEREIGQVWRGSRCELPSFLALLERILG